MVTRICLLGVYKRGEWENGSPSPYLPKPKFHCMQLHTLCQYPKLVLARNLTPNPIHLYQWFMLLWFPKKHDCYNSCTVLNGNPEMLNIKLIYHVVELAHGQCFWPSPNVFASTVDLNYFADMEFEEFKEIYLMAPQVWKCTPGMQWHPGYAMASQVCNGTWGMQWHPRYGNTPNHITAYYR